MRKAQVKQVRQICVRRKEGGVDHITEAAQRARVGQVHAGRRDDVLTQEADLAAGHGVLGRASPWQGEVARNAVRPMDICTLNRHTLLAASTQRRGS